MNTATDTPTQELPPQFATTLAVTDEVRSMVRSGTDALAVAQEYVIDSPDMAELANTELREIKGKLKKAEAIKDEFMAPLKQMAATINKYLNPSIEGFKAAETCLKTKLVEWVNKENARIEAERKQREEAERIVRQKADEEAARVRARAEAEAMEKQRQADEEAAKLRAAQEAGDAKAAKEAAGREAKLREQAASAIENGHAKAEAYVVSASAAGGAPAPTAAVPKGFGTRENWVAELTAKDEAEAKRLIVEAIGSGRTELLALLEVDTSAVNKLARALKSAFNVPGYKALDKPVAASRRSA